MVHEKERYLVTVDEAEFDFNIARAGGVFELENGGRNYRVVVDHVSNHKYLFKINDSVLEIDITKNNGELEIFLDGRQMAVRVEPYSLAELRKKAGMSAGNAEERHIRAPMPGLVLKANVKAGDDVKRGMTLVVIEAMKMENLIKAPAAGRIREVFVEAGQAVDKNDKLIEMEAE